MSQTTKERPILLSGRWIKKILDGRKTQTRRPVMPQPIGPFNPIASWGPKGMEVAFGPNNRRKDGGPKWWLSPFGEPGDALWVREAHYADGSGRDVRYRASEPDSPNPWTPSIHMPRWASRIDLEVEMTIYQQIQDMTAADAIAEGIDDTPLAVAVFAERWNETYGDRGLTWQTNPWIWAVTFKKVEV